jgi:curved DNA-binding protein CbpA
MRWTAVLALFLALFAIFSQNSLVSAEKAALSAEDTARELEIMKKTFYELFNVPADADTKAIKRAFRVVSLKNHPDKAKDEKDRIFRETVYPRYVLANDVLTNEKKRRSYDHLLYINRRPEKITDLAIENAWDEERGIWADERNWAPLEDWHSLVLIFGVTIAGFAVPIYLHIQSSAEKKAKAEKAKSDTLARIQAAAKQGQANFRADKNLQKKLEHAKEQTSKPIEKRDKKKTDKTNSNVTTATSPTSTSSDDKSGRVRQRSERISAAISLLVLALGASQRHHAPKLLSAVKKEVKASGETVPGPLKVSVAVYSTSLGEEEVKLLQDLAAGKQESLCASICSVFGFKMNDMLEKAEKASDETVKQLSRSMEASKIRQALVSVFINLSQADSKYPDPVALSK